MISVHVGPPLVVPAVGNLPSAAAYGVGLAIAAGDVYVSTGTAWAKLTDNDDGTTAINDLLTGFTSGAGTVAATDSILEAIQKLDGNIAAKADPVAAADGDFYVAVTSEGAATTKLTFTDGILTAITPPV